MILVISDSAGDAALVERLLKDEFDEVTISAGTERTVQDFDRLRPQVLILACNVLEKSQRHYLSLYRQSGEIQRHPHRAVVLCGKDEVQRAYTLCRDGLFDDYVLFWPVPQDAPRLLMVVDRALRDVTAFGAGNLSADMAVEARRLADMGDVLERSTGEAGRHIEASGRAMAQAEQEIGASLDSWSQRLLRGELPEVVTVKDGAKFEGEVARLKAEGIRPRLKSAGDALAPLNQWMQDLKQDCAPHLEAAQALSALAKAQGRTVLVVDDDELQRKMIGRVLERSGYHAAFSAGGLQVLSVLRKGPPDLILMDFMMPDIDGVEAVRRLKSVPRFAAVPVIMLTGNSERNVVMDALRMGAIDFIVKPFVPEVLLSKVAHILEGA